ncbi:MAG: class I SAM-dependent methyltransferase [Pseudomonadota bacterium]
MYGLWKRYLSRSAKNRAMVFWYNFISRLDTGDDLLFLNHGFAPVTGDPKTVELDPEDEKDRYSIQLYHQLAARAEWAGRTALEVSSGRGGGADFVMRAFRPDKLVGLDIAKASTDFCNKHFTTPGLSFVTGDAQDMPFEDATFDIVFTVESSLNYPDFDGFLAETVRILRPGGHLLITDYRRASKGGRFEQSLRNSGMEVLSFDDIAPQIIRGLELSEDRKVAVINKYAPRILRPMIGRFARVSGEEVSELELFSTGKKVYFASVLRKPG